MLKHDRSPFFRAITLLAIFIITILFSILFFTSGWVSGHSEGQYISHTTIYTGHAREQIENCLLLTDEADKAKCIIEVTNSFNEQRRSEANLAIQERIAAWTFGMLLASMLTTVVTSVGIFYVRKTLIQANETNSAAVSASRAANEANAIMRQESRPWVTIKREIHCEIEDNGFALKISWNYDLVNKGKSPAYDVKIDWKVVKRAHLQNIHSEAEDYSKKILSRYRLKGTPIIFPGEKTDLIKYISNGWSRYEYDHSKESNVSKAYLLMFICLSYRLSLNSDDYGVEVIAVGFEEERNWLGPYATKMLEYSSSRFIQ